MVISRQENSASIALLICKNKIMLLQTTISIRIKEQNLWSTVNWYRATAIGALLQHPGCISIRVIILWYTVILQVCFPLPTTPTPTPTYHPTYLPTRSKQRDSAARIAYTFLHKLDQSDYKHKQVLSLHCSTLNQDIPQLTAFWSWNSTLMPTEQASAIKGTNIETCSFIHTSHNLSSRQTSTAK